MSPLVDCTGRRRSMNSLPGRRGRRRGGRPSCYVSVPDRTESLAYFISSPACCAHGSVAPRSRISLVLAYPTLDSVYTLKKSLELLGMVIEIYHRYFAMLTALRLSCSELVT
jgi:hypothetical protein